MNLAIPAANQSGTTRFHLYNRAKRVGLKEPCVLGLFQYFRVVRYSADSDHRDRRPGQKAVDSTPHRHQPIEHFQLQASKRTASHYAPVPPPAGPRDAIEVERLLHHEASLFHARAKLRVR